VFSAHLASCRSCTPCSKKDRGGDGLLLLPGSKCRRVVVSSPMSESVDFWAYIRPLSDKREGLFTPLSEQREGLFTPLSDKREGLFTGTHIVWIRGKSLRGMTFDRFQHREP